MQSAVNSAAEGGIVRQQFDNGIEKMRGIEWSGVFAASAVFLSAVLCGCVLSPDPWFPPSAAEWESSVEGVWLEGSTGDMLVVVRKSETEYRVRYASEDGRRSEYGVCMMRLGSDMVFDVYPLWSDPARCVNTLAVPMHALVRVRGGRSGAELSFLSDAATKSRGWPVSFISLTGGTLVPATSNADFQAALSDVWRREESWTELCKLSFCGKPKPPRERETEPEKFFADMTGLREPPRASASSDRWHMSSDWSDFESSTVLHVDRQYLGYVLAHLPAWPGNTGWQAGTPPLDTVGLGDAPVGLVAAAEQSDRWVASKNEFATYLLVAGKEQMVLGLYVRGWDWGKSRRRPTPAASPP